MVLEVRRSSALGSEEELEKGTRDHKGTGRVVFLDLSVGYTGMFTL